MSRNVIEIIFLKPVDVEICPDRIKIPDEAFPGFIKVVDKLTGKDVTDHYAINLHNSRGKVTINLS